MKRLTLYIFMLAICLVACAQMVVIKNDRYYSVYDLKLQCPRQVGWTITPSDLGNVRREPSWKFIQDVSHPMATANHRDYDHSGYDRGHMCPAQDRSRNLNDMRSTFVMSNIAPQVPSMNRGDWKKTESFCRSAVLIHDTVQVISLPIFLDRDTTFIGSHRLAVPHAFIKAAWLPKNDSLIGLWFLWNR